MNHGFCVSKVGNRSQYYVNFYNKNIDELIYPTSKDVAKSLNMQYESYQKLACTYGATLCIGLSFKAAGDAQKFVNHLNDVYLANINQRLAKQTNEDSYAQVLYNQGINFKSALY